MYTHIHTHIYIYVCIHICICIWCQPSQLHPGGPGGRSLQLRLPQQLPHLRVVRPGRRIWDDCYGMIHYVYIYKWDNI